MKAFRLDLASGDYRDIMAGVDLLIEREVADPDKMGLMGWSYGGEMAHWTVTQTDRFKAISARQPHGIAEPKPALDAMRRNLGWFSKYLLGIEPQPEAAGQRRAP